MVTYIESARGVSAAQLQGGFFVGWPNPPDAETHLRLLAGSDEVILALDGSTGNVVGYITAITDGVLTAYIPYLEVLEAYQSRGIGSELVRRMLERLSGYYMIDLLCDEHLQPWYARFGMRPTSAMMQRNYERQSGRRY
jgi:ribosomal protein S18 acetylase RimI-like enzyme